VREKARPTGQARRNGKVKSTTFLKDFRSVSQCSTPPPFL